MPNTTSIKAANDQLAEFEPVTLKPRYECNKDGVFYIGVETDKDGETREKPPVKLSDPIELIGRGADDNGQHYRVIRWRDTVNRQSKTEALPMAEIGNNWQRLQSHGICIMAARRKRELLADYLQTDGSNERYTIPHAVQLDNPARFCRLPQTCRRTRR